MRNRLTLFAILLVSITESSGQKKLDLTGAWVLRKIAINGRRVEHTSGKTNIDTLFFSGENFRQTTLVILPDNQKIIGTRTGTFKVSAEKLEIKNLKSETNQTTATLPDEAVSFRRKKNEIIIDRPIAIHKGQRQAQGTSSHYYKKVK
jgi:hypothetical protein